MVMKYDPETIYTSSAQQRLNKINCLDDDNIHTATI